MIPKIFRPNPKRKPNLPPDISLYVAVEAIEQNGAEIKRVAIRVDYLNRAGQLVAWYQPLEQRDDLRPITQKVESNA